MSQTRPLKPRSLLLDTNVWINSQLGQNTQHQVARNLIIEARYRDVRLGIALHSLPTVFYVIHRTLRRLNAADALATIPEERLAASAKEAAWGSLSSILDYAEVVGADGSDARIACLHKSVHDDFEDDMVLAAARRMDADLIVTEDAQLIQHAPLPAMTPAHALRWLCADET